KISDPAIKTKRTVHEPLRSDAALILCFCLLLGLAHDRREQEKHLDIIGIAAKLLSTRADVIAKLFHPLHPVDLRNNAIGVLRSEVAPARRSTSLDVCWTVLRRRSRVERSTRLEVFAFEVDRADFGRIRIGAGLAIQNDGVGFPGIEQLIDD